MDGLVAFLRMGGYASFVWPAFVVTVLVLAGLLIASRRSLRRAETTLAALRGDEAGTEAERSR
jgi:heme exporter protein D